MGFVMRLLGMVASIWWAFRKDEPELKGLPDPSLPPVVDADLKPLMIGDLVEVRMYLWPGRTNKRVMGKVEWVGGVKARVRFVFAADLPGRELKKLGEDTVVLE